MREGEALVHPGAARQRFVVQLARREHGLAQLAIQPVAVVVHRDEVVVGADFLDLRERIEQRRVVPQPHVVHRCAVVFDVGHGELVFLLETALHDPVQRVGAVARLDVVTEIDALAFELVRRHDEALQHGRVESAPELDHAYHGREHEEHAPARFRDDQHQRDGCDDRDAGLHREDRECAIHVRVARSREQARRAVHQLEAIQIQPHAPQQQHEGTEHGEVHPVARGRGGERAQVVHRGARALGPEIHVVDDPAADCGEHTGGPQERLHHRVEGQREHVEARVVPEYRVGVAEGHCVQEQQHAFPAGGERDAGQHCQHQARNCGDRCEGVLADQVAQPGAQHPRRHEPARVPELAHRVGQVGEQDEEGDGDAGRADGDLRPQHRREDLREAHRLEPFVVDHQLDEYRASVSDYEDDSNEDPEYDGP